MASKIDFSPTPWSSGVSGFSDGLKAGASLGLLSQQKRINERQMQLMEIQQAEKQLAEQKKMEFEKAKAAASLLLDKASAMKGAPSAWKAHMKQAAIPAINALLPEEYQVDLDGLDLDNDDDAKAVSEMTSIAEAVAKGRLGRDDAAFAMNAIANRYGASEDMRKTAMDQAKFYLDAAKPSGTKPPPGYRYTAEGDLEAIPGGPAAAKIETKDEKDSRSREAAAYQADRMIGTIDEALGKTSRFSAGLGSTLSVIPGSDAKDLSGALDTIKANLGFAELQAMRQASPTGGALGAIAVQELNALQSTIASLNQSQSSKQLRQNLGKVKTHFENWRKVMAQAGQDDAGAGTNAQNVKLSGSSEDGAASVLSELAESEAWATANQSDPRAKAILRRSKAIRRFIGGGQ